MPDIWNAIQPLQGEIVGLAFSLISALILFVFRPRVRLLFGYASKSLNKLRLPGPQGGNTPNDLEVYVEKFFLQNTGSNPATDVEFVLSRRPADVNILPPREYEEVELPKGEHLIRIPSIAPKETVALDCFYLNQLASVVLTVKCREAVGKPVAFGVFRQFPNWVYTIAWVLIFGGIAFLVQLLRLVF